MVIPVVGTCKIPKHVGLNLLYKFNINFCCAMIWPSGLRRQLQALVRKGMGSNPMVIMIASFVHQKHFSLFVLLCGDVMHLSEALICTGVSPKTMATIGDT